MAARARGGAAREPATVRRESLRRCGERARDDAAREPATVQQESPRRCDERARDGAAMAATMAETLFSWSGEDAAAAAWWQLGAGSVTRDRHHRAGQVTGKKVILTDYMIRLDL
ncbi:hypothetical protein LR48_Vigan04g085400 [Vigna angularis]|uniref:Uncharacterized protein n=1 Tax=Phaseolus angularis TaxID=3914 RepID=A0A0L9UD66_PHAAN|nr:hypothetical protein LR48_Vigan04g085400 [Vigna angularis]